VKTLNINTDGAARGNPGPAGIGAVLKDNVGKVVCEVSEYLGEKTNNQAEYMALIKALARAASIGAEDVHVFADSELMVKQIKGLYKIKNEGLKPLYDEARGLIRKFKSVSISYVPRERNREADKLANEAIDGHFSGSLKI